MGLSASQGRMLLLTARKNDLEYRAQQISQKRLVLSQQLEDIAMDYEDATSNRQMKINLYLGGTNDSGQSVTKSSNLTYAALVSGTVGGSISTATSGIQSYSRTENQEYTSTSYYRLVSVDGAIVVSSADEIPNTLSSAAQETLLPDENGIYRKSTYNADGTTTLTNYTIAKTGSALAELLNSNDQNKQALQNAEYNSEQKVFYVTDAEGKTKIYDLNGAEVAENANNKRKDNGSYESVSIVGSRSDFSATTDKVVSGKKEGADGKYSIVDSEGVVLARYIVDESLKYGSTDQYGSAGDGPNYLQDCLRNGKYLIQQYKTTDNEGRWNSISWDATTNISDQYYTEDDDKAKAKYDRLQTQIQNQDKKLELELDNIETQRSAVTTEVESVQKVIDDNIESSFKAFA